MLKPTPIECGALWRTKTHCLCLCLYHYQRQRQRHSRWRGSCVVVVSLGTIQKHPTKEEPWLTLYFAPPAKPSEILGGLRNLTKGQQAMAMAMLFPDGRERGRGKKALVSNGFDPSRVRQARMVLHHSRSLAEAVLKGITVR
jgi:hypothetical protein